MGNNLNSPNKKWWDNNPMTYVDWEEDDRGLKEREEFEKLNQDYLRTNPYLETYFSNENVRRYLNNKKILDIGTGWGSSALSLGSCGGKVTAIDLSDASISGAMRNYELFGGGLDVEIIKMDAENLNFQSNTFDFIFSWGVIHHSNSTEVIVEQIFRVLKPGGSGLIMVYNRLSTRYYLLGLWYLIGRGKILRGENLQSVQKYFTDGYWHRHFTPKELGLLLKKSGLTVDEIELTYMARRILPGIRAGSVVDEWLKRKFGWLLVARFSKRECGI